MTESDQQTSCAAHQSPDNARQMEHRLLHLASQIEMMEQRLDTMLELSQTGQEQLSVLVDQAVDPQRDEGLHAQLAALADKLETQSETIERLDVQARQLANDGDMQALLTSAARQEQLEALETRLAKLVRTQFKTNTLNESQQQQLERAMTALRELAERREVRQEQRSSEADLRLEDARNQGRRELVVDLLPAIDGLELALASGRDWLAEQANLLAASTNRNVASDLPTSRWQRLRQAWEDSSPPDPPANVQDTRFVDEAIQATSAWLAGLELSHNRFVGLLAADGIQPIDARGKPFDPRLHVAIDTVERNDLPPDTVADVVRRGYQQGNRVIRYAEVIVTKAIPGE